jgi:hypothetical protein
MGFREKIKQEVAEYEQQWFHYSETEQVARKDAFIDGLRRALEIWESEQVSQADEYEAWNKGLNELIYTEQRQMLPPFHVAVVDGAYMVAWSDLFWPGEEL